ncbi:HAMP domain-containing histidine kinase [candidate division KSB1 bacterium]|nr:HAMP domain-containing histidine kinase [candidate division KSB1 bacterium]
MKRNHTYKLLSKTTFIYLIFTFIAFFSSALFLTHEVDEFIHKDMERRFPRTEHRIQHHIKSGKSLDSMPYHAQAFLLSQKPPLKAYPIYSDTLIFNSEMDENQHFRKKVSVYEYSGKFYTLVMLKSMDDFIRLRDDIFEVLIPAFILLAFGILGFNLFISSYLFRPFNAILRLMQTFKVGQRTTIRNVRTSTIEFKQMQDLFHQMIERIEFDYQHLKEYTENMAHEIQTPLTIIRNKVENLIDDENIMKRQAESVKIIYDETNHLSKLGNLLNLLTKIENGEFNNAARIHTRPVIEKQVTAISELAQLKKLVIETDLSDDHFLFIDSFLLDIVLKNLLRNALSHGTPDGPIRIKTTPDHLSVINFGPPLDAPESKLFERFYRNHQKKTSMGLGLALVKKICELNGLTIEYHYQDQQHIFSILS